MGRRKNRRNAKGGSGSTTIDRKNRSGHHQGKYYSDVYRDGKAYVYTAWNDNEEEVGAEMSFDEWQKAYANLAETLKANHKKKGRRRKRRK